MILLIDNYDSFSYNLYQLIGEFNQEIKVVRNDEITIEEIKQLNPSHIVLSPGPGKPDDAGICLELIEKLHSDFKILGVCLGHQAICQAFGMRVSYANNLMHGKSSLVDIVSKDIFAKLNSPLQVARYHSLAAVKDTLVEDLEILALSSEDEIMAIRHKKYPIFGVQFHPESILTPEGKIIMQNFLGI